VDHRPSAAFNVVDEDVKPAETIDYLTDQLRYFVALEKLSLTTDPAFVSGMRIGFVELMPQYMEPQLMPIHNSHFSLDFY
jgi:hypothetical protein